MWFAVAVFFVVAVVIVVLAGLLAALVLGLGTLLARIFAVSVWEASGDAHLSERVDELLRGASASSDPAW